MTARPADSGAQSIHLGGPQLGVETRIVGEGCLTEGSRARIRRVRGLPDEHSRLGGPGGEHPVRGQRDSHLTD